MEKGLAIITGADGGMGQVITAALAKEGYPVIMACLDPEKAASLCNRIQQETGNTQIEVRRIDLASLSSVNNFTGQLLKEGRPVSRLMNNAGILTTPVRKTEDGLETIVSVNYVAPSPVITIDATRMPHCKYSVLHVCHRPDRTGLL
jgi:retinol dehydrogenase-12